MVQKDSGLKLWDHFKGIYYSQKEVSNIVDLSAIKVKYMLLFMSLSSNNMFLSLPGRTTNGTSIQRYVILKNV